MSSNVALAGTGQTAVTDAEDARAVAVRSDRPNLPGKPRGSLFVSHTSTGRARVRWRLISFLLLVALPSLVTAGYLYLIASDQYVSEFRFTLRSSDVPSPTNLAALQGAGAGMQIVADSQAIVQYIESREVVDELQKDVDVRAIYSRQDADWLARLDPTVPVERVVEYWKKRVEAYFEMMTGTIIVKVRAFTPEDAFSIANSVANASERLVNSLSARARAGAVAFADEEVRRAEQRLMNAQLAVRRFRDTQQVLDPRKSAEGTLTLIGKLRDELSQKKAEVGSLRSYMAAESPTVQFLNQRIGALDKEIERLSQQVTGANVAGASDPLSGVITGYEAVETERQFAEKFYLATMELLQRARATADRQQLYVASFVRPSVAQEALYPQRARMLATVIALALAAWILLMLAVSSIRDHMT